MSITKPLHDAPDEGMHDYEGLVRTNGPVPDARRGGDELFLVAGREVG